LGFLKVINVRWEVVRKNGGVAEQLASNWTKWRQRKLIREKENTYILYLIEHV
jgi:hypothetical protein